MQRGLYTHLAGRRRRSNCLSFAIEDEGARYARLAELNVEEQCVNVIKTAFVQKSYRRRGFPVVHGWVYKLDEGLLRDLEVPFEQVLEQVSEIYRLE